MKHVALMLCLTLAACGNPPGQNMRQEPGYIGTMTTSPEDQRAAQEWAAAVKARDEERARSEMPSASVAALAHRMALSALPPVQLHSMLLGKMPNADVVLNGNLDQDYSLGWINNGYPATGGAGGHALRYVFGDLGSGMQAGNGSKMQIYSYHGIVIGGGRASTTPPATLSGSGASDPALEVSGTLKVDGATTLLAALTATTATSTFGSLKVGTSGTALSLVLKQSPTISFTCGASSCGDLTPGAVTGAALGGACFISAYDTSGAGNGQISLHCGVTSTGNVGIRCCNPTAAPVTVTSKTYSYWLVQ